MDMTRQTAAIATAIVFATGAFWGLYWLPVRNLGELGLNGAWGTVAISGAALVLLASRAVAHATAIRQAGRAALISIALGGAAFALYSVAFLYGRVAIVILLYFLTPVWSTLIARYVMGWPTPPIRLIAIGTGIVGLLVMLGADGTAPIPRNLGEWMGLAAGFLWSVATTGIRAKARIAPPEAAFVFAGGAFLTACALAPWLAPPPTAVALPDIAHIVGLSALTGGLWWAVSVAALMWATVRLEPARVGLLLMSEVILGALSAAWLAGEHLSGAEIAGGVLVLMAGLLEIRPIPRPRR